MADEIELMNASEAADLLIRAQYGRTTPAEDQLYDEIDAKRAGPNPYKTVEQDTAAIVFMNSYNQKPLFGTRYALPDSAPKVKALCESKGYGVVTRDGYVVVTWFPDSMDEEDRPSMDELLDETRQQHETGLDSLHRQLQAEDDDDDDAAEA